MTWNVPLPLAVVLGVIALVFGYHAILGWLTGVVRLPISVLTFEEFEREKSSSNFWGVLLLDVCAGLAAMVACLYGVWEFLTQ